MNQYDIVSIGDIVIDAFIRLKDANVHCKVDQTACELCVRFGDKVPYESVQVVNAVGNAPNASVSAARLGLKSALIATVGDDQNGKNCIASLENDKVSTEYLFTSKEFPTNYHYVLWYDVERTILVKHAPFPYALPQNMKPPKWIYLTSMGEQSLPYHQEIAAYISAHPETKLAFQPGTFQIKLGYEKLRDIYERTELFFCNVEEAETILNTENRDIPTLMKMLRELGPKNIVVTDGIKGAYAYDGAQAWFMPVYPHTPFERTGAGDAFASTITSALAMGMSIDQALLWAPINSMSVVQYVGAQQGLLTREKIEEYLKSAPADYKPVTVA